MNIEKWMMVLAAASLAAWSCGPKKADAPKVLVLYYSQTSNTKTVAQEIATRLGADIEEIVPVNPYSGDFKATIDRCLQEKAEGILPEVHPLAAELSKYDVIFLGYPVWFGTFAPPVAAVLDSAAFSGKVVVPFCTFGSGGLDSSAKDLAAKLPGSDILPGYGVRAARIDAVPVEVDRFLKAYGFIEGEYLAPADFPEQQPVTEEEAAIFAAAVDGYPMLHAKASQVASRTVEDGTEYLFTAIDQPGPDFPGAPREIKVYVLVENGKAPVFTQVAR